MYEIAIDKKLKESWQEAVLGCIRCRVRVEESGEELLGEIDSISEKLRGELKIEEIKNRRHIKETRACCKALGKDVKRYRNSSESMHRRILQGKGLYRINNVVEVNNLISIKTGYSLGTYDLDKVKGRIVWTVTEEGVHYWGIGKEAVNIEFLPVLRDDEGWFGNPNSDSTRAMITEKTTDILLCVFGFGGVGDMQEVMQDAAGALERYCGAQQIEQWVIK